MNLYGCLVEYFGESLLPLIIVELIQTHFLHHLNLRYRFLSNVKVSS